MVAWQEHHVAALDKQWDFSIFRHRQGSSSSPLRSMVVAVRDADRASDLCASPPDFPRNRNVRWLDFHDG
jgi:hypothetical protein